MVGPPEIGEQLIFDPILCYHNTYEAGYLPKVPPVEFHDNGSIHCVKIKSVKFVYYIKRHRYNYLLKAILFMALFKRSR